MNKARVQGRSKVAPLGARGKERRRNFMRARIRERVLVVQGMA
jgi:hypothetical protein